jgi:hypothetical protein
LLSDSVYSIATWQRHERVKWSKNWCSLGKIRERHKAKIFEKLTSVKIISFAEIHINIIVDKKDLSVFGRILIEEVDLKKLI